MTTLLVSAQRCGLNWVRYVLEHFTGIRTPGNPMLISKRVCSEALFVRTHDALGVRRIERPAWRAAEPANFSRVVLLLRNPYEYYVRTAHRRAPLRNYVGNIQWYDGFVGNKAVFYYEDFVSDPVGLSQVLQFFGVDEGLGNFDWKHHARRSRDWYDQAQGQAGGCATRSAPADFEFHSRSLHTPERHELQSRLRRRLGVLFPAYLGRYHNT